MSGCSAPGMSTVMAGFATRMSIATKEHMFAREAEGRTAFAHLANRVQASTIIDTAKAAAATHGHSWTDG